MFYEIVLTIKPSMCEEHSQSFVSGRQNAQQNSSRSRTLGGPLPDMNDHEAMQRFFLQQVF